MVKDIEKVKKELRTRCVGDPPLGVNLTETGL